MQSSDLLKKARGSISGRWAEVVITYFVYGLIVGAISAIPSAGPLIALVIGGPFLYGINTYGLAIVRGQDAHLEQIFTGFKQFERTVISYLLMCVYILLYALLLIIPGIIKAIALSMTFYILIDEQNIRPQDALKKSERMMDGHKMRYFALCLWFLFLGILCIFTLGIGYFFLFPYMYVTFAEFYDDLKSNYTEPVTES